MTARPAARSGRGCARGTGCSPAPRERQAWGSVTGTLTAERLTVVGTMTVPPKSHR